MQLQGKLGLIGKGASLLKVVEYPFAYSMVTIVAALFGAQFSFQNISNLGPLLLFLGFFATTLAITDPLGRIFRWVARVLAQVVPLRTDMLEALRLKLNDLQSQRIHLRQEYSHLLRSDEIRPPQRKELGIQYDIAKDTYDNLRANETEQKRIKGILSSSRQDLQSQVVKTKWIRIEVDKIVATVYFLFVIIIFLVALPNPTYSDRLLSLFQNATLAVQHNNCDPSANTNEPMQGNANSVENCFFRQPTVITITTILLILFAISISATIIYEVLRLRDKLGPVSVYIAALQTGDLNSEPVLEKMVSALDNGDWGLASAWSILLTTKITRSDYPNIQYHDEGADEPN